MAKIIGTPIIITEGLGGSGDPLTTPDWNQNDETAPDYIKNRTHWAEVEMEHIIPLTTWRSSDVGLENSLTINHTIIVGDKYIVEFDGVEYVCYGENYGDGITIHDAGYTSWLGNGSIYWDFEPLDNDLPFAVMYWDAEPTTWYLLVKEGFEGEHTIRITKAGQEIIHTIDEKFLPDSMKRSSYIATIGTTWEEDSETGVKYQVVAVSALTGADDEKAFVDHTDSSINGTSDGYALFVEEENQYLEFITNGRAETVAGGIRFEIFGDANTIAIPIEVRVG